MKLLNADEINSMTGYLVTQVDDWSVRFCTSDGVRYLVGIHDDIFIFTENSYWLYVVNETTPQKQDDKVASTISSIIRNLFSHVPASVALYMCAQDDGRQESRSRMFRSWFANACFSEKFALETYHQIDNGKSYYYGLIMRIDNPEAEYIIKTFREFFM